MCAQSTPKPSVIKVKEYLKNLSRLNKICSLKRVHLQHYEKLIETLQINTYIPEKQNFLFEKNPQIKFKQLQAEAILGKSQKKSKQNNLQNVSVAKQVSLIFSPERKQLEEEIENLQKKKQQLEGWIENQLKKEQPYLWEKILPRIHANHNRKLKLFTIAELEKLIKSKVKWMEGEKRKLETQSKQKQIENQVSANVKKMKLIMNQQVNIYDHLYDLVNDPHRIEKAKEKFDRIGKKVQQKINESLQLIKEETLEVQIETHNKNITEQKQSYWNEANIKSLNCLRQKVHKTLEQPLRLKNSSYLQSEINELQEEMDKLHDLRWNN